MKAILGIVLILSGWAIGFYADTHNWPLSRSEYWLIGASTGIIGVTLMALQARKYEK